MTSTCNFAHTNLEVKMTEDEYVNDESFRSENQRERQIPQLVKSSNSF